MIEVDANKKYVNPDTLWGSGSRLITFIYTGSHKLIVGEPDETHWNLAARNRDYLNDKDRKQNLQDNLVGRIGLYRGVNYVSFWNDDPWLYDDLLKPCLVELKKRNLIDDNNIVSTPIHSLCKVRDEITLAAKPQDWSAALTQHMDIPMGKAPAKLPSFLKPKSDYKTQAALLGIGGFGESFKEWLKTQN